MEDYSRIIKSLRIYSGLSQTELATKLNTTASNISKLESGNKSIPMDTFLKWIEVTNTREIGTTMLFGTEGINMLNNIKSVVDTNDK